MTKRGLRVRSIPGVMALVLAAGGVMADGTYQFTIDEAASSLDTSFNVSVPTNGTLIGDYDPVSNPTGTRTKPGIIGSFGETENVPVPLSVGVVIDGDNSTSPTGGFSLNLDIEAGTAGLSGLAVNLLGSDVPAIDITASLLWSTFRTRNPTCLVFGGITIPLPLGQATITTFTLAQTEGEAVGTLIPAGPDTYTVAIPVTFELVLTASVLGQELPPTPQELPLVFAATVMLDGEGGAAISVALEGFEVMQEQEGPIGEPFQIPFTEPVCQGSLLFNLQILGITVSSSAEASLIASGTKQLPPSCPCDWDQSGALGVPDIFAFLSSWFASDSAADFDGSGGIAVPDIFAFLSCWFARPGGCL